MLGYDEIQYFDEENYTDFQKEIDAHIKAGTICNRITDDNLFKFCWNKSNISKTSHAFDRFERIGNSQVERSSLKDKSLAVEFAKTVAPKIDLVNEMIKDFENDFDFSLNKEKYFDRLAENLPQEQLETVQTKFDAIYNIQQRELMGNVELKLIQPDEFETFLDEVKHFNIIGDDEHAKILREKFAKKLDTASQNIVITDDDPTDTLQEYIEKRSGLVIAKVGKKYFKNQSLFLISVPKAGTHLLFELAKVFGYREGGSCPSNPRGGYWYYTEYSNSHTSAKHFFNETVYTSDFGNRDHPFVTNPAIFIYRNPLDIVASEANYYHKEGKTSFSGYLSHLSYDERLKKLIDDKWLLGSIRDRISKYVAWNYFENVISVSFEELIGHKGCGDDELQKKLIWSLQLKLQVPGNPAEFAQKVFNKNSATFFKGKMGSYKELFKEEHYRLFNKLDDDFMREFGYSVNSDTLFSSKIEYFRTKKLQYNDSIEFPPILKESGYYGFNIVKYSNIFYGIPIKLGPVDLASDALDSSVITSGDINSLKNKILEDKIK